MLCYHLSYLIYRNGDKKLKKQLFLSLTITILLLSGLLNAHTVDAEASLKDRKANLAKEMTQVEGEIAEATKKIDAINKDIGLIEEAIKENEEEEAKLEKEIFKLQEEIYELRKEIKEIKVVIKERSLILKDRLSSYQSSGGDLGLLEVMFGSKSFEEFISRISAVTTITAADNDIIDKQQKAMEEVESKQAEIEEKVKEVEVAKKELEKVTQIKKDQREEYVEKRKAFLDETKKLNARKNSLKKEGQDIEALEEKARQKLREEREAKARAEAEAAKAKESPVNKVNSASTSKGTTTNKGTSAPKQAGATYTMEATAYTPYCAGCSGITATGINVRANPNMKVVAVDPRVIPLGSRVWVSGYGEAIAGDTGGAIKGNRIDLLHPNKKSAYQFGRRTVTVKVLK